MNVADAEYAALQQSLDALRAALEEQWEAAHDDHCTNMHDCVSFGDARACQWPRPEELKMREEIRNARR